MNSPPQIQNPPDLFNERVLIADVERFRVDATDRDEDELVFFWSGVPGDVEIPADPPIPNVFDGVTWWTSIYKVPRDPRLNGSTISVLVSDGVLEDRVEVEWLVTVEK